MTIEELKIPDGTYDCCMYSKELIHKETLTNYGKYVKNWGCLHFEPLSEVCIISILNVRDDIIIMNLPCISYSDARKYKKEEIFQIPNENTVNSKDQEFNKFDEFEGDVLSVITVDTTPRVNDLSVLYKVGDHVYVTKTESEMKYTGCCFRPEKTSIPIMRKIISITTTEDRVLYQLSGCGVHFDNKAIGDYVFNTYEDANNKLNNIK